MHVAPRRHREERKAKMKEKEQKMEKGKKGDVGRARKRKAADKQTDEDRGTLIFL